jgi:hypothetical protein
MPKTQLQLFGLTVLNSSLIVRLLTTPKAVTK